MPTETTTPVDWEFFEYLRILIVLGTSSTRLEDR